MREIHAAYVLNKLVVFKLDDMGSENFPAFLSKMYFYDLVDKNTKEQQAMIERYVSPEPTSRSRYQISLDPSFKAFLDRWDMIIPTKLSNGSTQELSIELENEELRYFIDSAKLADHPVFGTDGREPTIRGELISLSNGVRLHPLSDETQWVSTYSSPEEEGEPTTWRYQVVASEPGTHKVVFQLGIRSADQSGVRIGHKLYECTKNISVHTTWAARFKKLGLWTVNSVGAGLIGFVIAELIR